MPSGGIKADAGRIETIGATYNESGDKALGNGSMTRTNASAGNWSTIPLMVVSGAALVSFLVGWVDMGRLIVNWEHDRPNLIVFSLPYAAVTVGFAVSLGLACRHHLRSSTIMLLIVIAASAGLFIYDVTHLRAQMRLPPNGSLHYYFWWWYVQHPPGS